MKILILLTVVLSLFSARLSQAQAISFVQTNSFQAEAPSVIHSDIIELQHSSSRRFAAAVTIGKVFTLSYCSNFFYVYERVQTLAIFNNKLEVESYHTPAFRDYFTSTQQRPSGWSSFDNSVSHDLFETATGNILISGALEIFFHNPQPMSNCEDLFHSSKLFVYKTNNQGKIDWAWGYDITVRRSQLVELENGTIAVIGNDNQNNSFFLHLDAFGRVINYRVFPEISFSLIRELEETTHDLLIVGSSSRYKVQPSFVGTDIVCLLLDKRGNLLQAKSIGRNLQDQPTVVKFNPHSKKYFLVANVESNSGSASFDFISLEFDHQLNISNQMGWKSLRSLMAFDVLFDTLDKNRAFTFYGIFDASPVDNSKDFLLQTDLNGMPVRSFTSTQINSFSPFDLIDGFPHTNTFSLQSFPHIPTSLRVFENPDNEYFLARPSRRLLQTGNRVIPSWNLPVIEWKQTDLQLMRGSCLTDPVEIIRFNPELLSQRINPSFYRAEVSSYALTPRSWLSGSFTESVDCGTKENLYLTEKMPVLKAGEKQLKTKENLLVFPNPAQQSVSISLGNLKSSSPVDIRIIDISGREVFKNRSRLISESKLDLNIGFLKAGIYIIEARVEGRLHVAKLIKQNP